MQLAPTFSERTRRILNGFLQFGYIGLILGKHILFGFQELLNTDPATLAIKSEPKADKSAVKAPKTPAKADKPVEAPNDGQEAQTPA